ncbi:uncharacterized protein METZ01_LOCUS507849, partial [marine metagenome]
SFEVVNGQLKMKDSVSANYESKNSYSITVTATDAAGLTTSHEFTLAVNDVNEAPTSITLSASTIEENDLGAIVGTLISTDDDFGDTHTYTLSGADADAFEIVNGFQLKLKDGVSADYETQNTYSVTVTATDTEGATASQSFSVTVNDTNDVPILVNALTDQNSDEDSAFSFAVPANTFNDVDAGDSLTYAATLSDGSALPSWLSFDASTRTFTGTPLNDDVGAITAKVTAV